MLGAVRAIIAAIIAVGLAWSHWAAYGAGRRAVELEAAKSAEAASAEARRREQQLVDQAEQARRAHDATVRDIRARAAADVARLRERPSRADASRVSAPAAECPASTGAGLSREDAEFLVGEAARADRMMAALHACHAAYEAARSRP